MSVLAPGTATGVGSLPGTAPLPASRFVLDALPDLPHLPELPARGPGADMLGRTAALLTDLHVDLQPSGWRFVPRPGRESGRAAGMLSHDLDAFEEASQGYAGPLKVQVAGPWTLAAGIELTRGDKAMADPGAVRDIAAALAEGLSLHVADVRRRVPGVTTLLVQLDEPSLPDVLVGHVRTASGFGALEAVEEPDAVARLAEVLAAVSGEGLCPGVHCCAADVPVSLLVRAGARFVSVDATRLPRRDDDAMGDAVDAGVTLLLGTVPSAPTDAGAPELSDPRRTVAPARSLWQRLGFAPELLPEVVVLTPTCGLAGASPDGARAALRACVEGGRVLREEPVAPSGDGQR